MKKLILMTLLLGGCSYLKPEFVPYASGRLPAAVCQRAMIVRDGDVRHFQGLDVRTIGTIRAASSDHYRADIESELLVEAARLGATHVTSLATAVSLSALYVTFGSVTVPLDRVMHVVSVIAFRVENQESLPTYLMCKPGQPEGRQVW